MTYRFTTCQPYHLRHPPDFLGQRFRTAASASSFFQIFRLGLHLQGSQLELISICTRSSLPSSHGITSFALLRNLPSIPIHLIQVSLFQDQPLYVCRANNSRLGLPLPLLPDFETWGPFLGFGPTAVHFFLPLRPNLLLRSLFSQSPSCLANAQE